MDIDNPEEVYCADDDDYRIYCNVCEKTSLYRHYNNRLKSWTHVNSFRKRQQLNKQLQS